MTELPDLTISDVPLTVVQRVYGKGDPLGGNICPPVSNLHLTGLGLCACTAGQNDAIPLSCRAVQGDYSEDRELTASWWLSNVLLYIAAWKTGLILVLQLASSTDVMFTKG